MSETRRLKVAILGCGSIAKRHVAAVGLLSDRVRLAGVWDPVPGRAAELLEAAAAQSNGALEFATAAEAIRESDIVTVASPSDSHAEHAVEILENGKHLLLEKPMALSSNDLDRICRAAAASGAKSCVGYVMRFEPHIRALLHAVSEGRFGRIFHAFTNVLWNRGEHYYAQARWRGQWESDGGALMNQCTHAIDLLQAVIGAAPSRVYGTIKRYTRPIEAEDFGAAIVEFQNGAVGTIQGSVDVYGGNFEEALGVFGEKGTVVLSGRSLNQIRAWRFEDSAIVGDTEEAVLSGAFDFGGLSAPTGHTALLEDLLDSVDQEREPLINMPEARKSIDIVLGIYLSAKRGAPVDVPCTFSTREMSSSIGG